MSNSIYFIESFFGSPRNHDLFRESTMAAKALLRIKLVITPMRADDTVISSRTRGIWTDERDTRPQSLACHRRDCDLRAQLPHHLRRRCDAGCQAAMRTRVAFSPMQWGVWRTRITLIGPDPSCPAADDCVFGAHRRDDQRKAQQEPWQPSCKKAPTRVLFGVDNRDAADWGQNRGGRFVGHPAQQPQSRRR